MQDDELRQCNYIFEPKRWEREHDGLCQIDSMDDTDILEWVDGRWVWCCPHAAIEGHDECIFHLPPEKRPEDADPVEDFITIVDGERDAIDGDGRRSPQFVGATFEELDIDRERLGDGVKIDLRHASIGRSVWKFKALDALIDVSGAVIKGRVECRRGTTFDSRAVFQATTFGGKADFEHATFDEGAKFNRATFDDEAGFQNVTFDGRTDFEGATFDGEWALFSDATFEGERVSFKDAIFDGTAQFHDAAFDGRVVFNRAVFAGESADFRNMTFADRAIFRDVAFNGEWATFNGIAFGDKADFEGATFDTTLQFRSATFGGESIVFRNATFDGEWAYFQSTFFGGKASFEGATFDSKALFINSVFKRASFNNAIFSERVLFVTLLSAMLLPISIFQGPANFSRVTARAGIDFRVMDGSQSVSEGLPTFNDKVCFADASLTNCNLTGATFDDEASFEDANLERATLRDANLRGVHLENVSLSGADLRKADFSKTNLEGATLTRTQLYSTDFINARLHGTLFGDARISDDTRFVDSGTVLPSISTASPWTNKIFDRIKSMIYDLPFINEGTVVIYDPRMMPIYGDNNENPDGDTDGNGDETDEARGRDNNHATGEIRGETEGQKKEISNYTRAAAVYTMLELLARNNAASTLASTCFVWRKDMERKRYLSREGKGNERKLWPWFRSWASNLVVRYGESPYRILITGTAIVVSCGIAYNRLDLITQTGNSSPPVSLFDAMYFSTLTFTTLGLGDFRPQGQLGQILAIAETSTGVILLALLVFVFGRRATR